MIKKKTIKIDWKNSIWEEKDDLFKRFLRKNYNVIESNNPDFIIYSHLPSRKVPGIRKTISKIPLLKNHMSNIRQKFGNSPFFGRFFYNFFYDRLKMPILNTKAIRIFQTAENCHPDMDNCDWAFSHDYDEELKNPRHLRLTYYKFEGAGKNLIRKNQDIDKIIKEKTKFCAFIYSNNVPFRIRFFNKLSKYKQVDAPGNSMRNMPLIGSQKNQKSRFISGSVDNWQQEKINFLKQYKFVISFENYPSNGYTTEKIYHSMLANCIPIYWGNPLIHRDFNTKSFLNYFDFEKQVKKNIPNFLLKLPIIKKIIQLLIVEPKTFNLLIKRIIEIDKDDKLYKQYLKEPWYSNNKPTRYVDDALIEKQLRKIFG